MFQVIQNFSEDNKMNARNIAVVMGPTMFRGSDESVREVFEKETEQKYVPCMHNP